MGNVFSMYRMYSLYELARTRARENEALFGSREERAGEAGLSLLALLTLILVFSGKLWDGRQSSIWLCRGNTPQGNKGSGWIEPASEREGVDVCPVYLCDKSLADRLACVDVLLRIFTHTRGRGNAFSSCYKCSAELRYDNWIQLAACCLNTLLPLGQEQMAVRFLP